MSSLHGTPFAIVPEWLLYEAGVSDRAIRLYAVLARHADGKGRSCPSRQRLAELLGCSTDSVDRAKNELVEAEALRVVHRRDEAGDRTSNDYWLLSDAPGSRTAAATPPQSCGDGGRTGAATGSRTGAAGNESHLEREPLNETLLAPAAPSPKEPSRSQAFFAATAIACGIDPTRPLTKNERGRIANAAAQIASTGCDVSEVSLRAEQYRIVYPEMPLTPSALSSNWSQLEVGVLRRAGGGNGSMGAILRLAVSQ